MGTDKRERQKANRQMARIEADKRRKAAKRKRDAIRVAAIAVAAVAAIIGLSVWGGGKKSTTAGSTTTAATDSTVAPTTVAASTINVPAPDGAAITGDTPCPAADGTAARTTLFAKAPPMCIDAAKTYKATIDTNLGSYTVALDAKNAPNTVNSFVVLARYHYFDAAPCHRIIGGFMAQCGDPTGTGFGGEKHLPGYSFADENIPAGKKYLGGQLAMANSGADTNGSQFFTLFKDWDASSTPGNGYNLFGTVTEGLDTTVKAMEAAADPAADNGVPPKQSVTITKVTITES